MESRQSSQSATGTFLRASWMPVVMSRRFQPVTLDASGAGLSVVLAPTDLCRWASTRVLWISSRSSRRFLLKEFGSKVKTWVTFNEAWTFTALGSGAGTTCCWHICGRWRSSARCSRLGLSPRTTRLASSTTRTGVCNIQSAGYRSSRCPVGGSARVISGPHARWGWPSTTTQVHEAQPVQFADVHRGGEGVLQGQTSRILWLEPLRNRLCELRCHEPVI